MKILLLFTIFKKRIFSKWSVFKQSILYYPVLFSIIVFVGFLIISRIDQSFGTDFSINISYFSSLIFAGSADAARSILSTIAGGWATILGVAFSVTLITLQLSTTRYTSHIVNKFETDRINRLALGWFIAVILYSLLVLKTIRTGEGTGDVFIPIIGVNVAVAIALIGLFVFILFLNNISSYLKPKILVLGVVNQIISSIKPYEKREIDEKTLLHIRDKNEAILSASEATTSEQKNVEKLLKVGSKEEEGIVSNINWDSLNSSLKKLPKNTEQSHIWIEFHKFVGESVNKGNILVSVYGVNNNSSTSNNKGREGRGGGKEKEEEEDNIDDYKNNALINSNNTNIKNSKNNNKKQQQQQQQNNNNYLINDLEPKILSSININNDRDISRDPFYGIELLRTLSIKAASNNDIDVTNACITGLFKVLVYILKNQDVFGIPFTIKVKNTIKNNKKEKKGKDSSNNNSSRNDDNHENIHDDNYDHNDKKITITIKPKEKPLTDIIFSELSIINNSVTKQQNIPVMKHLVSEYVSTSKTLLEDDKKEKFYLLTNWFSQKLIYSLESFSKEFHNEVFVDSLVDFQNYLSQNYEYTKTSFGIYMRNIIKI
ncbi:MAG: DUF2254 family protein [Nitrososphaeraceae archaeon]